MNSHVSLSGRLVEAPKVRTFEGRGGGAEIVSLWIETADEDRRDRFTVEVSCPRLGAVAKALKAGTLVEVEGALRHDRWKDRRSGQWTGKVFIAIDPAAGRLKSNGLADTSAV